MTKAIRLEGTGGLVTKVIQIGGDRSRAWRWENRWCRSGRKDWRSRIEGRNGQRAWWDGAWRWENRWRRSGRKDRRSRIEGRNG